MYSSFIFFRIYIYIKYHTLIQKFSSNYGLVTILLTNGNLSIEQMEAESSNTKYNDYLKEVVYVPANDEKNAPQPLHLESENKPKDGYFLYISAFIGKIFIRIFFLYKKTTLRY